MLPKDIFKLPESTFRKAAVMGAAALVLLGIFFGFSIAAALFELGGILSAPGSFFVRCYGFLSFFIPAYLIYAAFLLVDPKYKPDRIFILASLTLPFVTLGLGFYWIRNFEEIAEQSAFFDGAGKTGIGFLILLVTVIECLLIAFFHSFLFSANGLVNKIAAAIPRRPKKEDPPKAAAAAFFLPKPVFKPRSLNDIYTESAALGAGADFPQEESPAAAGLKESGETGAETGIEGILYPAKEDIPELDEEYEEIEEAEAIDELEEISGGPEEDGPLGVVGKTGGKIAEAPEPISGNRDGPPEGGFSDVETALAVAEEAALRHESTLQEAPPKKRKKFGPYAVPVEGILNQYPDGEYWLIDDDTRNAALTLKETLKEFKIQAEVTGIKKGPVITMFEILPAPGVKLSRIVNLQDNIALRLAASSVRIVAPIPGKHAVGIEVPNVKRNIVSFREIIVGELYREGKKPEIPVILGKDITGEAITVDLATMPHLLIAGATGSGKSVCVNAMILSILYQKPPSECRLILIDPKIVELKLYNGIGHLLTPVITEPKRAFQALQYCIFEMERRYACLDSMGVRDIKSYNKRIREREMAAEHMPYIVVIIDEFADLMATTGKELESTVARLAAMSRAVGIHLVLATQRPSIDIITGLIKANIPSRIAFMVAGRMNSQIIIDAPGAEKLLGKGDMLYAGVVDPFPIRMQGAFVSEEEVERVVDYIKSFGEPDYIDEEIFYDDEEEETDPSLFSDGGDPLYEKALEIVLQQGKASASYIQRRLKIGYNRAARLVEEMEQRGVVGPAQGSKPREVLRGSSFG